MASASGESKSLMSPAETIRCWVSLFGMFLVSFLVVFVIELLVFSVLRNHTDDFVSGEVLELALAGDMDIGEFADDAVSGTDDDTDEDADQGDHDVAGRGIDGCGGLGGDIDESFGGAHLGIIVVDEFLGGRHDGIDKVLGHLGIAGRGRDVDEDGGVGGSAIGRHGSGVDDLAGVDFAFVVDELGLVAELDHLLSGQEFDFVGGGVVVDGSCPGLGIVQGCSFFVDEHGSGGLVFGLLDDFAV